MASKSSFFVGSAAYPTGAPNAGFRTTGSGAGVSAAALSTLPGAGVDASRDGNAGRRCATASKSSFFTGGDAHGSRRLAMIVSPQVVSYS